MFRKILVANRGEIAIRAFRAATELDATTVAVFPAEDRTSEHRMKADEAYQIGEEGHPVRAYLDHEDIVRVAREAEVDAIYPGYGFLSENPQLAEECARHGITFIGPGAEVLELTGNKARAIAAADAAGLPTLQGAEATTDLDALESAAEQIGFPVFVKAVSGGGGRGMRRVERRADLRDALEAAQREAESAFGDPTLYLEEAVINPRHIEVQVLGDASGEVIHFWERDCSVQRRHQKVVEIAPAPDLDPDLRERMCADAVRFAESIDYVNAGTVEFLLGEDGRYVFIEMNPRIQVEHTVTEEVTERDLVVAQMQIAAGATFTDLGLRQDDIRTRGFALQCRITTEDPANGFRPDSGTISAYRSAGGSGVRLDGGTTFVGAEISPHFDSMLVKLTCRAATFPLAVRRARRALAEFRVRGVATNLPFLDAVLSDPTFQAGEATTSFIDERPHLLDAPSGKDRATKLLTYLADVSINQPHGPRTSDVRPASKLPGLPEGDLPEGSRDRLLRLGPAGFAADLRSRTDVAVTDTTFRDAHQSLLATRVRTRDLVTVAEHVARLTPQLLSVEAWGGATYDVALRFLHEDPWERLDALHEAMPNVPLQMLLRGRNTVGYTPYPTRVTDAFVAEAARSGLSIFRIFDSLNDVSRMRPAVEAVRATDTALAEVALCYTGDLLDPGEKLYTLDYYLRLAEQIVETGAHVLAIKDMAGLLRAPAADTLVRALRSRFDLPVHLHTHDTAGGQIGTLLAAVNAGVDAVDAASATMAGTTSQPSLSALVAGTDGTDRPTGLDIRNVFALEPYWEAVRRTYAPFESGLSSPTGRVYRHEIPGGQLSNLRQQAIALGLGERFEEIEDMYAAANTILGNIVKVTPSSKAVGDLALALVGAGADPSEFEAEPSRFDIPDSVIGFLRGDLGDPPGGWPEPFRTKALAGREVDPPFVDLTDEQEQALGQSPRETLNELLFPGPHEEMRHARETFGDTSVLDTGIFLHGLEHGEDHDVEIEPGKTLTLGISTASEPDEHGMRTVMGTVNGQLRPVQVRDRSVEAEVVAAEKADPDDDGQVAAPFAGVVTLQVDEGAEVEAGDTVATIEAMKMEASITTSQAGTVRRTAVGGRTQVEGGDLLVVVE
ncbi:pyruvate carboxylase [Janibacter cremeus]|uniref:Pyruvate carboxylase n=1 Tax=Janibacter cremeus TaxID=1285192 RepID=A0A852VR66_9MICO|nr:pyruvate carboxylase [Janibacter cremeus]NYF99442.1 pyruvate carboxylase [Janibacter cremeus]